MYREWLEISPGWFRVKVMVPLLGLVWDILDVWCGAVVCTDRQINDID